MRFFVCSLASVSTVLIACSTPRPPTFVEVEGEDGPIREWAPEDTAGNVNMLPFYTSSKHMDACTSAFIEGGSQVFDPESVGGVSLGGSPHQTALQVGCFEGRIWRSMVWLLEPTATVEPCGGEPVVFGTEPSLLIRATDEDVGTVEVVTDSSPECVELEVCRPIDSAGVVENALRLPVVVCQDPGRTAPRPGAPAEAWTDCGEAAPHGMDGDTCSFEGGCLGWREVARPSTTYTLRYEVIAWCGDGILRFASVDGPASLVDRY